MHGGEFAWKNDLLILIILFDHTLVVENKARMMFAVLICSLHELTKRVSTQNSLDRAIGAKEITRLSHSGRCPLAYHATA